MNKHVPNLICLFRICMIPFVLLFLLDNPVKNLFSDTTAALISAILFAIAMISDAFDGHLARKYNLITNMGKFLDPIADKMLVLSIFVAFVEIEACSSVPVILILAREFFITGLRLGAAGKGSVVAANMWGKVKTTLQGIAIAIVYLFLILGIQSVLPQIFIWATAIYSVISVIPYFMSCKQYLKD